MQKIQFSLFVNLNKQNIQQLSCTDAWKDVEYLEISLRKNQWLSLDPQVKLSTTCAAKSLTSDITNKQSK